MRIKELYIIHIRKVLPKIQGYILITTFIWLVILIFVIGQKDIDSLSPIVFYIFPGLVLLLFLPSCIDKLLYNKDVEYKVLQVQVKSLIKNWLLEIDRTEKISSEVIALNFNLYQPYAIELNGSNLYDNEDEDWACEDDFLLMRKEGPLLGIPDNFTWEEVLDLTISILKELSIELVDTQIFQIKHITAGFVDGNLIVIK